MPAEWHGWLHYTIDTALPETGNRPWQKPHLPNATGTPLAYRPPGHDYRGGHRAAADGDYRVPGRQVVSGGGRPNRRRVTPSRTSRWQ